MLRLKGSLAGSSIASRLFLLTGTALFLAFFIIAVWSLFGGVDTTNIGTMKIMQLFETIGMFILPPLMLVYLWEKKPAAFLHLDKKSNAWSYIVVAVFMMAVIPFINLLGELNQHVVLPRALSGLEAAMKSYEEQAARLTTQLLDVHTPMALLLNILVVAIAPAMGEELFFRGTVQGIFRDWKGVVLAIWITAIIFSAIHLQFYGFFPRMLLGAFFGYLLWWSDNLWLPITAHFVNNVVAVIFYYLKYNGVQTFNIDTIGTGDTLWIGLLSGVAGALGVYYLKTRFTRKEDLV